MCITTMSFKREGDDRSQLNLLKKRRVAELLANEIPDDEALLMRNGRYACTVCGHRPVFDTVDMLAIHRQGKKHKNCLDIHYARKRNFALEVQKRTQEIAVRRQDIRETQVEAPLLQNTRITARNALLKAAPYDSRSKAHQSSAGEATASSDENKGLFFQTTRRQHLQQSQATSSQSELVDPTEATPANSLPGNTNISSSSPHPSQTNDVIQGNKETKSYKLVKESLFANTVEQKPKLKLQPYVPKSQRKSQSLQNPNTSKASPAGPLLPAVPSHKNYRPSNALWVQSQSDGVSQNPPSVNSTPKTVSSRLNESQSQSALHNNHTINKQSTVISTNHQQVISRIREQISLKQTGNLDSSKVMKELLQRDAKKNTALEQVQQALVGKKTEKPVIDKADGIPTSAGSCTSTDSSRMAERRRKELQHHLHLTSSGWKRDYGGNWVKDEDVEFDSDEETPPDL